MRMQGVNLDEYYRHTPGLREYYVTLPGAVQAKVLQSGVQAESPGELLLLAEHLAHGL